MDKKEMDAKDIEQYLAELGATLKKRGVEQSIHIMIIGGAYMLAYEHMNRTTTDIDIFWLETDEVPKYARDRQRMYVSCSKRT